MLKPHLFKILDSNKPIQTLLAKMILLQLLLVNSSAMARPLNPDSSYFWPVVIALMIISLPLGFFIGSALGMMVGALGGMSGGKPMTSAKLPIKIGGGLGLVGGPALVYLLVIL